MSNGNPYTLTLITQGEEEVEKRILPSERSNMNWKYKTSGGYAHFRNKDEVKAHFKQKQHIKEVQG